MSLNMLPATYKNNDFEVNIVYNFIQIAHIEILILDNIDLNKFMHGLLKQTQMFQSLNI